MGSLRLLLRLLGCAGVLATFHFGSLGCRTVSDEKTMEIAAELEVRTWYDAQGQGGACEAAPKACPPGSARATLRRPSPCARPSAHSSV